MSERFFIVGAGVVGFASGQALLHLGHRVTFVDTRDERCAELRAAGFDSSTSIALDDDRCIIALSVPTPSVDAAYDLSHLRSAVRAAAEAIRARGGDHIVVVRSTVAPQTCDDFVLPMLRAQLEGSTATAHVASVPEFLRQATALDDALHPTMTVIGAHEADVRSRLKAVFGALGGAVCIFENTASAELVKIAHNCFNAAKISFFNELYVVAAGLGLDGDDVANVIVRSAEASTNIYYGTKGGYPFGGACLPKDLDGLIDFAENRGLATPLLRAVREVNDSLVKLQQL